MLQVAFIREQTDRVLKGLEVRNFANAKKIIDDILQLDEKRRGVQGKLDEVLSESNKISKEIGIFFKSGETQKATLLKEKTGQLKEES
ncbi:MAG: serine--tRNA ligase, partial [Flavobacteriaceae bacterium]|nr:serine--tRNA ligase [Flavobacteriaceae bacterium]